MKILIYAHSFAPHIGGVETITELLAGGLARSARDRREGEGAIFEGSEVTVVTQVAGNGCDENLLPYRIVRRPSRSLLWTLLGDTDVVHLAGPAFLPLMLALLRRKRVVIEHHSYQAICPNGLLLRQPERVVCEGHFRRRRYDLCLRCTAVTEGNGQALRKVAIAFPRLWMCRHARFNIGVTNHVSQRLSLPRQRTIYHGVPDASPPQHSTSRFLGEAVHRPACFAYVGRLVQEKGLQLLLEAARRLKDEGYEFHLRIIGDGPELSTLQSMVDLLSLHTEVRFRGALRGEYLARALVGVDAIVMPSIWEETAGLAAIEQMMRGCIVIASNIGGLGEIVEEAGFKHKVGDSHSLADCMRELIVNPGAAADLKRAARRRALAEFSESRMVNAHLEIYRAAVAAGQ